MTQPTKTEVIRRLIGHPPCPRCGGRLTPVEMSIAERKRSRIGGARVYQCAGQCKRSMVLTRAEGAAPYIRELERESPRRMDLLQMEMDFGPDGDPENNA